MCVSLCVCVCVSVCLSVCPGAYLPNHRRDLYEIFLHTAHMAVVRSSSGGVTKSQRQETILGIFFPTDSALYNIAFGTHTKTVEPNEMLFGLMTRVGPRYPESPNYEAQILRFVVSWSRVDFAGLREFFSDSAILKSSHQSSPHIAAVQ